MVLPGVCQSPTLEQYVAVGRFPTGSRPLGIAQYQASVRGWTYVATANSGDNTVSVLSLSFNPETGFYSLTPANDPPLQASYDVPSPFGVVACDGFLMTSSSGTTISWLKFRYEFLINGITSSGLQTMVVGPQPYSAACTDSGLAWVSTLGDSTLSLVDGAQVLERIPNVPGSRALHGIAIDQNKHAWVAGTDANIVTVVNLTTKQVVVAFPVQHPIAVYLGGGGKVYVASAVGGTLTQIDTNTLQVGWTIAIPSNTEDLFRGTLSYGNSVGLYDFEGQLIGVVPDIPGALGVSAGSLLAPSTFGIFVTSRDTDAIFLIQRRVLESRTSNAASFESAKGVVPGSLASYFAATNVVQAESAQFLPLPTMLAGVSLRIGGTLSFVPNSGWAVSPEGSFLAPLLYVGPNQINFQVPQGIDLSNSVPVELTMPDGATRLSIVNVAASAPGLFSVLRNGQGQGAILNTDSSLNLGTNPAARGSVIQIFATGAGETDPPLVPGEAAPETGDPLVMTRVEPTVTIGGQQARVLFSGMAPGWVGLWQINAEIPANIEPGPAVPLLITADGIESNTVTIAVE
jgi:uncharacterized protein (TIGR03437 family)